MKMTKWEYLLEKIGAADAAYTAIGIVKPLDQAAMVRARLEKFGDQGWELVAVTPPFPGPAPASQGCSEVVALLYFKRPKQ